MKSDGVMCVPQQRIGAVATVDGAGRLLIYMLAISFVLGTNFPVLELSGRMLYLGPSEVLISLLAVVFFMRLTFGKVVFPRNPIMSIVVFSLFLPITVGWQAAFGEVDPALNAYLEIVRWYEYIVVLFVVLAFVRTERQIKNIMTVVLIGFTANIAAALYQASTFNFYEHRIYGLLISGANREGTSVSNPNVLGALAMTGSLFLMSFWLSGQKKNRTVVGLLIIPSVVVLIMSFSRSSYLGFLSGAVLLAGFHVNRAVRYLSAIGVVLMLFAILVSQSQFLQSRLSGTFYMEEGQAASESIKLRIHLWETVVDDISDHFVIGIGYGNYESRYRGITPDNYYLEILTTTGVVGLALMMWMFVNIGRYVSREKIQDNPFHAAFRAAYLSAFVGLLVASIFGGLLFNPRLAGLFWLFTGLIFRSVYINRG